jgi:hypothetical protein
MKKNYIIKNNETGDIGIMTADGFVPEGLQEFNQDIPKEDWKYLKIKSETNGVLVLEIDQIKKELDILEKQENETIETKRKNNRNKIANFNFDQSTLTLEEKVDFLIAYLIEGKLVKAVKKLKLAAEE